MGFGVRIDWAFCMSIGIKPFYSIESLAMRLAFMSELINILNP